MPDGWNHDSNCKSLFLLREFALILSISDGYIGKDFFKENIQAVCIECCPTLEGHHF